VSLSLYSIASELVALKQLRDDAEYEGDGEAVKVIDGQIQEWVELCLATKADGIRGYLEHLRVQQDTWEEEAARYSHLAADAKKARERLKVYVLDAMRLLEAKTIEGRHGEVLLRRRGNGGIKPLVIAQPELVPADYKGVTITVKESEWERLRKDGIAVLNRKNAEPVPFLIREALERGEGVPGCRLDDRGEHLIVE
jgi:hypothetical protein